MSEQKVDVLAVLDQQLEFTVAADYNGAAKDHSDLVDARAAVAEMIAADQDYDAAITALSDLNRRIAEQGWIELEHNALREAGALFVRAQSRRLEALARIGGEA